MGSGYILLAAAGFVSGALARNTYETAVEQDVPATKESWFSLLRRFWAIVAVTIFFVSFARTFLPYLGLAGGFAIVVVVVSSAGRSPVRSETARSTSAPRLFVISMLVIAGTSQLGGFALGLVARCGRSPKSAGATCPAGRGTAIRWGIPIALGVIVYVIEVSIPTTGSAGKSGAGSTSPCSPPCSGSRWACRSASCWRSGASRISR